MRLLANENFPREAVEALRELGHDVAWVHADARGSTDPQVMERAVREKRILVTLDKDFGELAFRARILPSTSGVVLLRVFPPFAARVTALATKVFTQGRDYTGLFILAEEFRIRERPLPTPSDPTF